MKKVLLTGATGFLGSNLAKAMLGEGYKVIFLKRSTSDISCIQNIINDMSAFNVDKCPLELPFEKHGNIDCVIHTATSYGTNSQRLIHICKTNIMFPLKLLTTALSFNVKTFINVDTILNKYLNYYALSKNQFREWGQQIALTNKMRFINVKMEYMYGPNDDSFKFVTYIIQRCLKQKGKLALTAGEQRRDFIYIDDVVSAYLKLINKCCLEGNYFQEYELGSGKAISIRELVEMIHCLTNSRVKLMFGALPYRKNEVMESKANICKLENLGWKPQISLKSGLMKTIASELKRV